MHFKIKPKKCSSLSVTVHQDDDIPSTSSAKKYTIGSGTRATLHGDFMHESVCHREIIRRNPSTFRHRQAVTAHVGDRTVPPLQQHGNSPMRNLGKSLNAGGVGRAPTILRVPPGTDKNKRGHVQPPRTTKRQLCEEQSQHRRTTMLHTQYACNY